MVRPALMKAIGANFGIPPLKNEFPKINSFHHSKCLHFSLAAFGILHSSEFLGEIENEIGPESLTRCLEKAEVEEDEEREQKLFARVVAITSLVGLNLLSKYLTNFAMSCPLLYVK